MKSPPVRVVIMAGPAPCNKAQFKPLFRKGWEWVEGIEWKQQLQLALQDGSNVIVGTENCTHTQQNEVYFQITCFNIDHGKRLSFIDLSTQVVILVCHPSCGYGNAIWNHLMVPQTTMEMPLHSRAYRVLDMDDGKTIHWNTAAITAASKQRWSTVACVAQNVAHAEVPRDTVGTMGQRGNLSIMSYNILWQPAIRCTWEERKPTLIRAFTKHCPDIICLQEVGVAMYRDICTALPLYGSTFGIADNTSFGCATFFRHKILEASSEVPLDYLPPRNYQHKKPRVVAHVTVVRHRESKQNIVVCNTHLLYGFNEYMEQIRHKTVQEIAQILERDEYKGLPQLMCGDFNSEAGSRAVQEIIHSKHLVDTYQALVCQNPEMTVEPYQHEKPIAVDYMFATKECVPVSVLNMPTIASMRRVQLPIPGFEGSDHLFHLADYRLEIPHKCEV
jgi:endonuclease/exonuclease/phosphatase family metal-dependent hydrolase